MVTFNHNFRPNSTSWRLKMAGPISVNVWRSFILTDEMEEYLRDIDAYAYRYVGIIIFDCEEDITCFMLAFGL